MTLLQDVRPALRALGQQPGFALAAILTLALGIGANVTVFSIANAILLRPLPFGDRSDRVVTLHSTHTLQAEDWADSRLSYPDLVDVRAATTFEGIGGHLGRNFTLTGGENAERVLGGSVTPNLFPLLGVEPVIGRGFTEADATPPGLETTVLLTHGLWVRRFGGDLSIVGQEIVVNELGRTVIGILPPGFKFPERAELYMPFRWDEAPRSARNTHAVGVLRPGVAVEQAQSEMDGIAARLAATYPTTNRGFGLRVLRFRDSQVGSDMRVLMATLLGAVGFVLLIACANLANLLLVRGAARQREMAVRAAMGASRGRLVTTVLVEAAVLSVAGAALGALGAVWAIDYIRAVWPEEIPYWVRLGVDTNILLFVLGVAALTALAIGLAPALRASRPDVVGDLKEGARGSSLGRGAQRLQGALVVGQVALCLALLVGANLMVRSFMELQSAELGFDDRPVLSMRAYLPGDQFDPIEARTALFARASAALTEMPGVVAAAATSSIPGDDGGMPIRLVGADRVGVDDQVAALAIGITPTLFDTFDLRLPEGRTFTSDEAMDPGSRVAIVNQALARRFFGTQGAVGQRLGIVDGDEIQWHRVVGVAPDVHYEEFGEQTDQSRLNVYLPYARLGYRTMAFLVRFPGAPGEQAQAVREALRQVNAGMPVYDVRTMTEVRRFTTFEQRFFGMMMGGFAFVALLLACLGVYALLAYATRRRRQEIGVRLALGARPADVVSLFVGQGTRLAVLGLGIGLVLALGVSQAINSLLFGVNPFDPWLFAGTGLVLAAVVLAASFVPARRAARTDPMVALRYE